MGDEKSSQNVRAIYDFITDEYLHFQKITKLCLFVTTGTYYKIIYENMLLLAPLRWIIDMLRLHIG